jgi:hypothetical protein
MAEATLLDPFPERVKAFAELVKAVGQQKLQTAQAELTEAVTAGQWVRARIIETTLAQLQADFDTANHAQLAAGKKIRDLDGKAHAASMLLRGTQISAYTHARDAYRFFEKQALIEADESLFTTTFKAATIRGSQFLDNRSPEKPADDPQFDDETINALQLMDWALQKQYIARPGSKAQQSFVRIFKQIAEVAKKTLTAIEGTRDKIRTQVFETWKPVQILGVEPTAAEKRILTNPGPKSLE